MKTVELFQFELLAGVNLLPVSKFPCNKNITHKMMSENMRHGDRLCYCLRDQLNIIA